MDHFPREINTEFRPSLIPIMDYLCILLNDLEIRDRKTKKQELRYRKIENIELRIEIQLETTIDLSEDTLKKKYD